MQVETYLFFDGRCEEAMEFYRDAIGAQIEYLLRFTDSPVKLPPEMAPAGAEEKIFHATLRIGETQIAMADDLQSNPVFGGFALLLRLADIASAERIFAALSAGGAVKLAIHETFWSPRYGIVTDRFGVMWKLQVVN